MNKRYVIKVTAVWYFECLSQLNNVCESKYLCDARRFKTEAAARAYAAKYGIFVHCINEIQE